MTLHFSLNLKFFPDSQQEFEKFHSKDFQVIHAVFWSWWLLGCSFDSFTFSGPCKYASNVNLFDKAVFTPFTCDSEIPCSFWVCVFNHSEAKETGIFPYVEQTEKQAAQGGGRDSVNGGYQCEDVAMRIRSVGMVVMCQWLDLVIVWVFSILYNSMTLKPSLREDRCFRVV